MKISLNENLDFSSVVLSIPDQPKILWSEYPVKGIEYLTPDTVKAKILEVIKADKRGHPFYVIWDTNRDTTYLRLAQYSTSDSTFFELIKNSNRFITLDEKHNIPIITDTDLDFSTLFHQVKNKGKKNGILNETSFNISGYNIYFTGTYYEREAN